MNKVVKEEINSIINEGWTDGMAVIWGSPSCSLSIYEGKISGSGLPVSNTTIFDLASVTKIFFLVCVLRLVETNQISLEARVGDYSRSFPLISNLHIYELMNFSKLLQTPYRIDQCSDLDECISMLHKVEIVNGEPRYSDIGSIVLTQILEELPSKGFREILSDIKKECKLYNTYFGDELPENEFFRIQSYDNEIVNTDNNYSKRRISVGKPHDSKAQILGVSGHAGVFSTPEDISLFCKSLLLGNIISFETLSLVCGSKYDCYIDDQHFGLFCYKKSQNKKKSEIPTLFSDSAFAISGYTGVYLLIDPEQKRYISINSNRIYNRCPKTNDTEINGSRIGTKDYVYRKDVLLNSITSSFDNS